MKYSLRVLLIAIAAISLVCGAVSWRKRAVERTFWATVERICQSDQPEKELAEEQDMWPYYDYPRLCKEVEARLQSRSEVD